MSLVEDVELESRMTVDEYLAFEEAAKTKHEYVGGYVYAMAGASTSHIRICANLNTALQLKLRGGKCEFFGTDLRLTFSQTNEDYYYYADGTIVCDPSSVLKGACASPTVIFEVISESTRGTDEREKRQAYRSLPSVEAYVRIEQDRPEVVVEFRVGQLWRGVRYTGLDAVADLGSRNLTLPLLEIYERVEFPK